KKKKKAMTLPEIFLLTSTFRLKPLHFSRSPSVSAHESLTFLLSMNITFFHHYTHHSLR
ncbi:MraY-inhibiting host cell lysis protein E, partial [Mammaliicoccus sciuri]